MAIVFATVLANLSLITNNTGNITLQRWRDVNFDTFFQTPQLLGHPVKDYNYWRPAAQNCNQTPSYTSNATIGPGLSLRVNGGTSWSCFVNAEGQAGHFPWQMAISVGVSCKDQIRNPDFYCPRQIFGLQNILHDDFNAQLVASGDFQYIGVINDTRDAAFHINLSTYWWFQGNVSGICPALSGGCAAGQTVALSYMEAHLRVQDAVYSPVSQAWTKRACGHESSWIPSRSDGIVENFGYSYFECAAGSPWPGLNGSGSFSFRTPYNVTRFFQGALNYWHIPPSTHAILVGIDPHAEGYNIQAGVLYRDYELQGYFPDYSRSDTNANHVVDAEDLSLIDAALGKCPGNYGDTGGYTWLAEVLDSDNDGGCITASDASAATSDFGHTY